MSERTWEAAFLEARRLGRTQQEAADFADVALKTVKRHLASDRKLRDREADAVASWRRSDAQRRLDHVKAMLRHAR